MAEVTRRRVGELMQGVLRILSRNPEGLQAAEVIRLMEAEVPPTEFERGSYTSRPDSRRYDKVIRFSTINLVKAGWLIKSKGHWSITDEGRDGLSRFTNPEELGRELGRLYREWKGRQVTSASDSAEADLPEDEVPERAATLEEAEDAAWGEIEAHLQGMSPYDFQELVAALLRAMGYHVMWVAPAGKDGGTDVIAHLDPLGTSSPRIRVQIKRRSDKVAVDGLRAFMAVLGDQDVGIFVSTGGFTKDAESESRAQQRHKVTLVDLKRLFELWVKNYDRVAEADRWRMPLRPVYYLAPEE